MNESNELHLEIMEAAEAKEVTQKDILKLAKSILITITGLALFGSISEMIHPSNNIFPAMREILPSMATMVIGFYFGKSR